MLNWITRFLGRRELLVKALEDLIICLGIVDLVACPFCSGVDTHERHPRTKSREHVVGVFGDIRSRLRADNVARLPDRLGDERRTKLVRVAMRIVGIRSLGSIWWR